MDEQNKRQIFSFDRKEVQKLIDYFICRLRRALLFIIASYFMFNIIFTVLTIYITSSTLGSIKDPNLSKQKKEETKDPLSPWKEKDIEAINAFSASNGDEIIRP